MDCEMHANLRLSRSYNTRNTPRPNENYESPMASCSTSAICSRSKEHVDFLGDTKDEVEEWSQDHDDQHLYDETRPFAVHELVQQHVPPINSCNPSPYSCSLCIKFCLS